MTKVDSQLLLDTFPHPAMIIREDRRILAANDYAIAAGAEVGDYCWKGFGNAANLSDEHYNLYQENPDHEGIQCIFCRADNCLTKGAKENDPLLRSDVGIFDTYWVPISSDNYLHFAIDITERKQKESEILKSQQLLTQMGKISQVGGWSFNIDSETLEWTDEVYKILEVDSDYIPNIEDAVNFYTDESKPLMSKAVKRAVEYGETFDLELEVLTAKGNKRTVHTRGLADLENHRIYGAFQDITERKRMENAINAARSQLQATLNALPDLLFEVNSEGRIFSYHSHRSNLLAAEPEVFLDKRFTDVLPQDAADACQRAIDEAAQSGFSNGETYRLAFPQGEHWFELSVAPLHVDDQSGQRFIMISREITVRKQAQLALEQKNQELEQFVYSVSHDLKSPLVTVKTFAGMLRQDLLNDDQPQINEDLNYIDKAADKMQQLLDALLRYSRIGRIDAPAQTVSADQQAQSCLTTLAGILQQHQVQVSTSELPYQLHGSPMHFGQILQNLIENAVKYRGEQPLPHIEIGSMQQGHEVVFYVRDNGMGIAPEHRERIFNLFSQLSSESDGSGLGLALVKKIVTIYQGRIWVESDGEGKGSCFMFTLPGALVKDGSPA